MLVEELNRPDDEVGEPSPVMRLPAIWLKDLVPFPGEHYELAIDAAVRRAIATAVVDEDLVLLVPAQHRGIGVVAHLDELKRSRSLNGDIELGVTATTRARLLGETAPCAPLLTVLVLEHEPRHTDALEESMPELAGLLQRYLEQLHLDRGRDLLDDMDRAAGASDQWSERTRLRLLSTTDPERRARMMARLMRASLPRLRYDRVLSRLPAPEPEASGDLRQILKESGLAKSAVEDILKGLKGARQEVLDLAASLPWGKEAAMSPNAAGTRAILDARHFGGERGQAARQRAGHRPTGIAPPGQGYRLGPPRHPRGSRRRGKVDFGAWHGRGSGRTAGSREARRSGRGVFAAGVSSLLLAVGAGKAA
jgi:hypothetical protein